MADALNFQIPTGGYGTYLQGILPDDQRVLAGAFATAMQQINNINQVDLQKFAQVVFSGETVQNLPLVNGTDVPTDVQLAVTALGNIALGGGIYGTYTMSNFFGCMSGLPYPLQDIQNGIQQLQTTKLTNIYQQLYLAVNWQQATATATITLSGGNYSLTGFTINNPSGGYGRGTAPAPTVTVTGSNSFSATATAIIGTDPNDLTTYGKVTGFTITDPGTQTGNPGTTTTHIQAPPTAVLAVNTDGSVATGGTNTTYSTTGWTGAGIGMDAVVQDYITQADTEIIAISVASTDNFNAANTLNTNYNITGTALKQEQRARYIAISPVPIPRNNFLNIYPTALYVFTDSIPSFALETLPHMAAQTLENISDLNFTGGQSIIGAMRQDRNQARLQQVGIPLTNNIPDTPTDSQIAALMLGAEPGVTAAYPTQPTSPAPIASYSDTAPKNLTIVGTATPLPIVNGLAAANTLPTLLNTGYTSSTLSPATYSIPQAIDHVIECNCDCWVA